MGNVSRETRLFFIIFLSFLIIGILIPGCGEDSITEDISGFNKKIEARTDIKDAEELMKMYHEHRYGEDTSNIVIEGEKLYSNRHRITLIKNGSSGQAEKLVMVAKVEKTKWKVLMVERNWRCISDKGESDWGLERCE